MTRLPVQGAFKIHAGASSRSSLRTALFAVVALLFSTQLHAAFSLSVSSSPVSVRSQQYEPGAAITLSIATLPAPTGPVEWFHDGKLIAGASGPSFTINSATTLDSGNYRVRVTSGGVVTWSDDTTLNVIASPAAPIDSTFNAEVPGDLTISTVFGGAADGSLIVQGYPRSSIADFGDAHRAIRLRPDGGRDLSLDVALGSNSVIAVLSDGRLITSRSPFRLSATGAPAPLALPAAFDSSKPLDLATLQPDGKLLIAQSTNLARLNPDGSIDGAFAADLALSTIHSLTLDPAGRILVYASRYDPVNSLNYGILERLTTSGARDSTFHRRSVGREYYYPSPLPEGGYLLEYYWSNFEGPLLVRLADDGTEIPNWTTPYNYLPEYAKMLVDSSRPNRVYTQDFRRFLVTSTGLTFDPTFFAGIKGRLLSILPDGKLLALRTTTSPQESSAPQLVRLRTTDLAPPLTPTVSITPGSVAPIKGSTLTLTSTMDPAAAVSYQWLALDGQPLPSNTTSSQLVISNFSSAHLGRYQLRATTAGGASVLSNVSSAEASQQLPYLANLSGRAMTGTGENTVIAGLASKRNAGALGVDALLRGAGPALRPFGVTNYLPNPAISVYGTDGRLIANNDQWSSNPQTKEFARTAGAIPFDDGSNDAALLRTFYSETATIHLLQQDGRAGVGLLEIYRAPDRSISTDLVNLSFRARTAPGEETAIAGFVIVDPQGFDRPARVLLRAVGPTLAKSGIEHPLENPILTVYNSSGQIVAQNDNWPSHFTAELTEYDRATSQVGAFQLPQFSADAGLLVDLPAGAYSMHATGGAGVVLLEIYLVR